MNKIVIVFALVFSTSLGNAQDHNLIKLQCEGTYSDFSTPGARDLPVKGIYVEITGDRVSVHGSPGFDSVYSVTNRSENGLGIQLDSNTSYGGFLNRFSGELSIAETSKVRIDGNYKIKQMLNAVCNKARALF